MYFTLPPAKELTLLYVQEILRPNVAVFAVQGRQTDRQPDDRRELWSFAKVTQHRINLKFDIARALSRDHFTHSIRSSPCEVWSLCADDFEVVFEVVKKKKTRTQTRKSKKDT